MVESRNGYERLSYVFSRLASLYLSDTISHVPLDWRWRTRSEWLSRTSIWPPADQPLSFHLAVRVDQ